MADGLLSVAEAQRRMLAGVAPLAAEQVPLLDGLGRVLAEPLRARRTQPPFPVSAMDGWAVRAADLADVPAELRQIGEVPAGARFDGVLTPGTCVRIFTGAPLPDGADAIVIQENATAAGHQVTAHASVVPGQYVRPAGLDFAAGEARIPGGRALTVRDIGLAAAMNVPWLMVRRRPRVAILSTGDEIVMPGDPIGPNQIVSANAPALWAFVIACGGQPLHLGVAPDDPHTLARMAQGAIGADILVTSGGASVGTHDVVRDALGDQGLRLDFWRIAMRPGKPLMFGRIGPTLMLGLPGNPVSGLVCALLFLRPLLRAMQGLDPEDLAAEQAVLGAALPANDSRQDYVRARLERQDDGSWCVIPHARQDSSMFAAFARSDCLVVRRPADPPRAVGDRVDIIRFPPGLGGI